MYGKFAMTQQPAASLPLSAAPTRPRRKMRWWMPTLILMGAAGYITYLHLDEEMDNGMQNFLSLFTSLITLGLLTVWYLFFTGLSWRQFFLRTLIVGSLVGLFYVGVIREKVLRFEGATGNMLMRFSWAWTPRPDENLPELKPAATAPIDVAANTRDFPQFLGPSRQAVVRGIRLARDWVATPPREVWRQEIGLGWGSFAIQGALAITQEQRGDRELTVCRDTARGAVYWTHQNVARFSERIGGDGPRATPTIAEGRVYVLGATGILDCLELATGALVWSTDTLGENGSRNLTWGKSSSPLVVDDLVLVSLGEEDGDALAAYDKVTGKRRWKAARDHASYCSPALVTLAGKRQIVSVNAKSVTGHDLTDGKELWNYTWPNEMPKASQPAPLPGDRLLLTAGYGGADCPSALVLAFEPTEGRLQYKQVWGHTKLKTKFTTAVVRDGFAYALDDGVLACIDVATGERKWRGSRFPYGHGQVLLVEDLLLVQAEEPGDLILVEADPARHVELGRIKALASKTWNNPALSGRHLLLRNDREAVCYELPMEGDQK